MSDSAKCLHMHLEWTLPPEAEPYQDATGGKA